MPDAEEDIDMDPIMLTSMCGVKYIINFYKCSTEYLNINSWFLIYFAPTTNQRKLKSV